MGIFRNVALGGVQAHAVVKLDEPLLLQQEQGPGLVGGVVGHRDLRAVRQLGEGRGLAGVEAEGLVVDARRVHQMGAAALVEVVHVGDVLEVVGQQGAVLHGVVGLDVVVILHDLQGVAVLGHEVLGDLQDLRVGGRGGAHLDGLVAAAIAAAGGQHQSENQSQGQSKCLLFHFRFLLLLSVGLIRLSVFTDRAVPMD